MTVAVTGQRLKLALKLIQHHAERGLPPPTNQQIALAIGMGQQKYQPHDRTKGLSRRWKKAEAGSVMVKALEMLGYIQAERIGRNRRNIIILADLGAKHGS